MRQTEEITHSPNNPTEPSQETYSTMHSSTWKAQGNLRMEVTQIKYWADQKICSGFSIKRYGKTQRNLLAKPNAKIEIVHNLIWQHRTGESPSDFSLKIACDDGMWRFLHNRTYSLSPQQSELKEPSLSSTASLPWPSLQSLSSLY